MSTSHPTWAEGLERKGEYYYYGYVDKLDDTLAKHSSETITTYGTRRSRKGSHVVTTENSKTIDTSTDKDAQGENENTSPNTNEHQVCINFYHNLVDSAPLSTIIQIPGTACSHAESSYNVPCQPG